MTVVDDELPILVMATMPMMVTKIKDGNDDGDGVSGCYDNGKGGDGVNGGDEFGSGSGDSMMVLDVVTLGVMVVETIVVMVLVGKLLALVGQW